MEPSNNFHRNLHGMLASHFCDTNLWNHDHIKMPVLFSVCVWIVFVRVWSAELTVLSSLKSQPIWLRENVMDLVDRVAEYTSLLIRISTSSSVSISDSFRGVGGERGVRWRRFGFATHISWWHSIKQVVNPAHSPRGVFFGTLLLRCPGPQRTGRAPRRRWKWSSDLRADTSCHWSL